MIPTGRGGAAIYRRCVRRGPCSAAIPTAGTVTSFKTRVASDCNFGFFGFFIASYAFEVLIGRGRARSHHIQVLPRDRQHDARLRTGLQAATSPPPIAAVRRLLADKSTRRRSVARTTPFLETVAEARFRFGDGAPTPRLGLVSRRPRCQQADPSVERGSESADRAGNLYA